MPTAWERCSRRGCDNHRGEQRSRRRRRHRRVGLAWPPPLRPSRPPRLGGPRPGTGPRLLRALLAKRPGPLRPPGHARRVPAAESTRARASRLRAACADPVPVGTFLRRMTEGLGVRCLFLPLPFAPVLAMLRVIEALRLPFPLRSESLLGLKALRQVPVADDLRWLGLRAGTAEQSLADLL